MSITQFGILPDFIGIGPGRTGTTWLDDVLRARVCLPGIKETKFFTIRWERGIEWYASLFRHCAPGQVAGEICPYFAWPHAPERIAQALPNCKIIVTLRDPVDRTYSHYKLMRANVFTRGTLEEAMAKDKQLREGSRYGSYLARWLEIFGREQVLVADYDDLRGNPQAFFDPICDFIGIPRFPIGERGAGEAARNAYDRAPKSRRLAQNARHLKFSLIDGGYYRTVNLLSDLGVWHWCMGRGEKFPALTAAQDAWLRELYRPEIDRLEQLLGRDFSKWKLPRAARQSARPAASEVAAQ
jgi:Sulfotransferase domain